MEEADIGLIGLAVMGQNLALNMNDKGFTVAVFNRTVSKVDDFMKGPATGTNIIGTKDLKEFISKLKRPRKIILMVKAGDPVDRFIEGSLPLLEKGDILIDGGNSHFPDTNRRCNALKEKGILYVGAGISGGEEGARHGPSIMPGGHPDAWPYLKEILQATAAKADTGEPCCDWVGDLGAGHYVKMVHNGIEYGDMQLICESYHLMKEALGMDVDAISEVFGQWNRGDLESYLIEISKDIFSFRDEEGESVVEKVLDVAGQKGTGKWTAINSLELGMPLTLIGEAVFARFLSSLKEERGRACNILKGPSETFTGDKKEFLFHLEKALFASKVVSYAQGFLLMRQAAETYNWTINYGSVALMWREGCIIRSAFLGKIKEAYEQNSDLEILLTDDYFKEKLANAQEGWREVIAAATKLGIPIPCMSTALSFYDGYRTKRLPANLLQAQRDYFGAHTYERIDRKRGEFFHTNWTGKGGRVSSTVYSG